MIAAWPPHVERVATFLREAGAEGRLEELGEDVVRPVEAAELIGCALDQIVECRGFVCDGRPALVLVPASRRPDPGKVARAMGAEHARAARPDELVALTGCPPETVAPFPPGQTARVLAEQTLLTLQSIWVSAGSTRHVVALSPPELFRLTRAQPMDVVEEPTYHSSPERTS
ncbi:MAG TPA: YbaK/EbsC family protein [Gaiellaceae bacterium]|nr:YbaK/EbsC family protein [Gaiellaceae bacterium]